MKTCHVCGNRVSNSTNECPNCGYKFQKESYGLTTKVTGNERTGHKSLFVVVLIVVCFVVTILFPAILFGIYDGLTSTDEMLESEASTEDMSLDLAISQGYDRHDTLQMTIDREQEIYDFLDGLGLEDMETYEYWNNSYDTLYASAEVGGYKDEVYYEIDIAYANGVVDEENVYIERTSSQSVLNEKKLNLDVDILSSLGDYLEIKDIYQTIDTKRFSMKRKEDEMYYQDDQIYITEYTDNDQYDLTITIFKQ